MEIYLTVLFITLTALCDGLKDQIKFNWDLTSKYFKGRYKFWNPSISWNNKWKVKSLNNPIPNTFGWRKHWWYLNLYKPAYVERFPFSSTMLVSLTDGWHLLKEIKIELIIGAITVLTGDIENQLYFRLLWGTGFNLMYKDI